MRHSGRDSARGRRGPALLTCALLLSTIAALSLARADEPATKSETLSWRPKDTKRSEIQQLGDWSMRWLGLVSKHELDRYSLWARYGLDPFDPRLSGTLREFTEALLHFANNEVGDPLVEGTVPHRRAYIAVYPMGEPRAPAFDVTLVEEDGWRILRVDPLRVDRWLSSTEASGALASAERVWSAIDTANLDGFVPMSAIQTADRRLRAAERKEAETLFGEIHKKYASRPRTFLPPLHVPENGYRAIEVATLVGERDALLYCLFGELTKGDWRLVRVTEGDPKSVSESAAPGVPKAGSK